MTRQRWNVVRTETSPTMGVREVILTRQPVRPAARYGALADALGETLDHMGRGGFVRFRDLRPHECHPAVCKLPEEHTYHLTWTDDPDRETTLRLVEA